MKQMSCNEYSIDNLNLSFCFLFSFQSSRQSFTQTFPLSLLLSGTLFCSLTHTCTTLWPFSAAVLLSSCLDDSSNSRPDPSTNSQYVTGSIPVSRQPTDQLCPHGNCAAPAWLQHSMCCSSNASLRECQSPTAELCPALRLCHTLQQPYRWVSI